MKRWKIPSNVFSIYAFCFTHTLLPNITSKKGGNRPLFIFNYFWLTARNLVYWSFIIHIFGYLFNGVCPRTFNTVTVNIFTVFTPYNKNVAVIFKCSIAIYLVLLTTFIFIFHFTIEFAQLILLL